MVVIQGVSMELTVFSVYTTHENGYETEFFLSLCEVY